MKIHEAKRLPVALFIVSGPMEYQGRPEGEWRSILMDAHWDRQEAEKELQELLEFQDRDYQDDPIAWRIYEFRLVTP